MKLTFKTRTGYLIETSQVDTEKELFKATANLQAIFAAEDSCGCCQSPYISYRFRTIDENDYYDLVCNACSASFRFGQTRKGSLFPKRKDDQNQPLPNRGWSVWKSLPEAKNNALVSQPRKVSQ